MPGVKARCLAIAARCVGYAYIGLLITYILVYAYGIWSRQRQLDWQVTHPLRGTDTGKLKQYFMQIGGVAACEWAEELERRERSYSRSFSGYIKLTPLARAQFDSMVGEVGGGDSATLGADALFLLPLRPRYWYPITAPPGLQPAKGYSGSFYYERTNGVVQFSLTRANR